MSCISSHQPTSILTPFSKIKEIYCFRNQFVYLQFDSFSEMLEMTNKIKNCAFINTLYSLDTCGSQCFEYSISFCPLPLGNKIKLDDFIKNLNEVCHESNPIFKKVKVTWLES